MREHVDGLVNPYRAVTDTAVAGEPAPESMAPLPGPQRDPLAEQQEAAVRAADENARGTATLLLVATVGGLALVGITIAGRRRRWAVTRPNFHR